MAAMSARAMILQAQQAACDGMREKSDAMRMGGRYGQAHKRYALNPIDEYGARATARILHVPRRCSDGAAARAGTFAGVRRGSICGQPNGGLRVGASRCRTRGCA